MLLSIGTPPTKPAPCYCCSPLPPHLPQRAQGWPSPPLVWAAFPCWMLVLGATYCDGPASAPVKTANCPLQAVCTSAGTSRLQDCKPSSTEDNENENVENEKPRKPKIRLSSTNFKTVPACCALPSLRASADRGSPPQQPPDENNCEGCNLGEAAQLRKFRLIDGHRPQHGGRI